jgi:hypothetical protein
VLHAQALIEKTVELAKGGDTTDLRPCLARVMAPIRAKGEPVCIGQPGTSNGARASHRERQSRRPD